MRLLLDTHALIWAACDPRRLSERVRDAIRDPDNDVEVSAVVGWEISTKRALGKLRFPDPDRSLLERLDMSELPITLAHCAELAALEKHHRDPFDRMLIAQSRVEEMTLVTSDQKIVDYDVEVFW